MLVADTHVHIYPNVDLEQFFTAALSNFSKLLERGQKSKNPTNNNSCFYLLYLTERWDCSFYNFYLHHSQTSKGGITITPHSDLKIISVENKSSGSLLIIPGRQIITKERLEVLALGTDQLLDEGLPIRDTIRRVNEVGSHCVLPWSYGKWLGSRGKIVKSLIEDDSLAFSLGDPGHRARFAPNPSLLTYGAARSRQALSGSDPLPLPQDYKRVGSYCSLLEYTPSDSESGLISCKQAASALNYPVGSIGMLSLPTVSVRLILYSQLYKSDFSKWNRN